MVVSVTAKKNWRGCTLHSTTLSNPPTITPTLFLGSKTLKYLFKHDISPCNVRQLKVVCLHVEDVNKQTKKYWFVSKNLICTFIDVI